MPRLSKAIAVFALTLAASPVWAGLTDLQTTQVEKSIGTRVLTSDGAIIGKTNGARISQSKARIFIEYTSGAIVRPRGATLTLVADPDTLTLTDAGLIVPVDRQYIRTADGNFFPEDEGQILIVLP
ncbi:MAG: hypothetical protein AAGL96_00285 [Pseudomonadota bacterium]|mgnify:CR=1 FL=1